jgi:ammonia channel protein AmtB
MTIILGALGILIILAVIWKMLPDDYQQVKKDKKMEHAFFTVFDILALWTIWIGFNEIKEIIAALHSEAGVVRVGSRIGFYAVCIGMPLIHIFLIVNSFMPVLEKKYSKQVNICFAVFTTTLLAFGFFGSSFIKMRVENAGYVYCRNASGISALARTLVYTKNMDICEKLVETKRKR